MSVSGEVLPHAAGRSPDLLDDATRVRLRDVRRRDDPVIDARRWTRATFLLLTLVVWFPTMWSGTKAAELAVQQWGGAVALTVGLHVVLQTANRYARENATQVLRRDSIARSVAAREALAAQTAIEQQATADLKAEIGRRAAAERKAASERKGEAEQEPEGVAQTADRGR